MVHEPYIEDHRWVTGIYCLRLLSSMHYEKKIRATLIKTKTKYCQKKLPYWNSVHIFFEENGWLNFILNLLCEWQLKIKNNKQTKKRIQ